MKKNTSDQHCEGLTQSSEMFFSVT